MIARGEPIVRGVIEDVGDIDDCSGMDWLQTMRKPRVARGVENEL